ncbi:hypothetical protein HPB50_018814 [Hyalomma asiaticum]|uniref:Uncharacterized protein n=1 Tax=Hyalomma asiaticum TaxID=266040 RepID=A0ACB7SRF4_HYAAI|nr:hypothetical protein HPB50_018814 [Hyalomma asiaticum]
MTQSANTEASSSTTLRSGQVLSALHSLPPEDGVQACPATSLQDAQLTGMRSWRQAETENIATDIYDKLPLESRDIGWTSPAARRYVANGLYDPTQAAILCAKSFQDDPETFVLWAVLL